MASIIFPTPYPPQAVAAPPVTVWNRVNWADAWTAAADLWCTRLALSTGETISSAAFYRQFGQYLAPGAGAWSAVPVLAINPRSFCRVVVTGTDGRASFDWRGIWRRLEKSDNVQTFQAVGLEQLLEIPCIDLPYWDSNASVVRWAGRGLTFNRDNKPNRGPLADVNGQYVYTFSDDEACTDYWSTLQAVETLLAAGAPLDASGNVIFRWMPRDTGYLPEFDKPVIATHGRTFLELLRSLVPKYRLIGWTVEPYYADMAVRFFSFTEATITLTDADGATVGTIPANANQHQLEFAYDQSSNASLVTETSHVADQVIVRGDRRQIVCTLSPLDGSIEAKWLAARETAYLTAASSSGDYPAATEIRTRQERDRDARNVEELRSVYAWYGPPKTWDQTAGDGEGGASLEPIAVDDDGNQFFVYPLELVLQRNVPAEIDGARYDEELPILCFARAVYAAHDPSGLDRWVMADQMGRAANLEQEAEGNSRSWSLAVRPLAESIAAACWLESRVQNGEQHVLAATEFTGREDAIEGSLAWESDLIYTVCLEDTRHLEARYPPDDAITPIGEQVNRLYLDAPGYRYVDVRPNTVVAIRNTDQQLERSVGAVVVDDTNELLVIAERTYQWHATPRYALGFSTGWIDAALQIGHLITQLTDATSTYPVRSVVSEITLEFPVSNGTTPQRPTMSITTAFAEMDAQRIV